MALSGMSTMEQVTENLRIAQQAGANTFTAGDNLAVDTVRQLFLDRTKVGCTACGYCLPCPSAVAIPKIFSLYNEYYFTDDPAVQQVTRYFYLGIMGDDKPANSCTQCGACLDKCPQHIDIPREMAMAAKVFHPEPAGA